MYLLDSNAWIAIFRGKSASLLDQLKQRPATEIVHCPIVIAELWYGVCRSTPPHRVTNQRLVEQVATTYVSVPFDEASALDSAELRAYLASSGQLIGAYDLLIAAIVRVHGLTLVTHNTAEFSRVPNLRLEDWQ